MLHPDKTLDKPAGIRIKAEKELMQVNEAYNVLKNPLNKPKSFHNTSSYPEEEPVTYSYPTSAYQTQREIPSWVKPLAITLIVFVLFGGIVWFVVRYWRVILIVLAVALVLLMMGASNNSRR